MNDLERDLREVLDEDARRVPTPTSAPEGLRRSVRRRQAVFGSLVGLSALAIVAGIVAADDHAAPDRAPMPRPGVEGADLTTGTLNGIIDHLPRAAWFLIDPDVAGLNSASEPIHDFPGSSSRCPRSHRHRSASPARAWPTASRRRS